jgi:phosphoribosylamine--glycine ligase
LLAAAAAGSLPRDGVRLLDRPYVAVVLAAKGYPDTPETGQTITGLERAAAVAGALVFHAATARRDDAFVTTGGRVLTVVGSGATYTNAIGVAYDAASHIHFSGMQFRRDIGQKALGRSRMSG